MKRASSLFSRGRLAGVVAAIVGLVAVACGSSTPPEAAPGVPMNPPKENALLDDFMNPPTRPTVTATSYQSARPYPSSTYSSAYPKPSSSYTSRPYSSSSASAYPRPSSAPSSMPSAKPSAAPAVKPTP